MEITKIKVPLGKNSKLAEVLKEKKYRMAIMAVMSTLENYKERLEDAGIKKKDARKACEIATAMMFALLESNTLLLNDQESIESFMKKEIKERMEKDGCCPHCGEDHDDDEEEDDEDDEE